MKTVHPLRQAGPSPAFFHGGPVTHLEVDPRQRFVLSQGERTVRVWTLASGEHVSRLAGVLRPEGIFGFDSGGRIAGWHDGALRFWDPETGECVRELSSGDAGGPLAAIGGGRFALANVPGGRPAWWDLLDERPLKRLGYGVTGSALHLAAMSDDGQRAWVVRHRDEAPPLALRVWDLPGGAETRVHEIESANDYRSIVAAGGLVALGGDRPTELRDAATFAVLREIPYKEDVGALALSPDGSLLVVIAWIPFSGQPEALLYRTSDAKLIRKHRMSRAMAATFTPDGERYVIADWEGTLYVFDARSGDRLAGVEAPPEPVALAFEPDGTRAVVVREEGDALMLDATFAPAYTFSRSSDATAVDDLALIGRAEGTRPPDGGPRTIRYDRPLPGDEHAIYVWGPGDGYESYEDERAGPLAISPDGASVVSGRYVQSLRRWAVDGGRISSGFRTNGPRDEVTAIAWTADAALVLVAANGVVWVLDALTGVSRGSFKPGGHVECLAADPAGPRVAVATRRGTDPLTLWDLVRLERVAIFEGHESDATCVAFNPVGTLMLSGGRDRRVLLWEAP